MIALWLDDIRPVPKFQSIHFTHWAKTAEEAISLLSSGEVEFISLDHDLSEEHYEIEDWREGEVKGSLTGYDVACWIERAVFLGEIQMPGWACHSANPSGRARIIAAMQRAQDFADAR